MAQLTEKESRFFADWYLEKYGKKDENGEYITPVEIPDVPASEQEEDMKEWAMIIYKMLGKKVNDTYKYRTYSDGTRRRETMFEKAFNSLFLQYGPRYVEEDGKSAKKYLWLDDVIDVKEFIKTGKL